MSIEFFMSLLRRYNLEGTAIFSTWDLCVAEQAATCRLDRSSLRFMGLSATQTMNSLSFDRVPLFGLSNLTKSMHRVLADLAGQGKDSANPKNAVSQLLHSLDILCLPPKRSLAPPALPVPGKESNPPILATAATETSTEGMKSKRKRGAGTASRKKQQSA